ncbi:MAG: sensor histidine kinase [Spirochaetes bacterium]|nr:sensor histidine kinase [Spirochaetota bacterium]MBU1079391.1 sensor histidine kinase [Spirochaetota bacterium]
MAKDFHRKILHSALRVAGIYAAVSFAWIAFSDRAAAALAEDYAHLAGFQTAKGFFFVAATSTLLFFFSKRQLERLVAAQSERERDTTAALKEKDALLREINHRVKNNLQVIISLLHLHGRERGGYMEIEQKVRSMALVHELVTSSPDMSTLSARSFAERLADALQGSLAPGTASIRGDGDDSRLSADEAVPIGIIIAEACSNSAKHAGGEALKPVSVTITIRGDGDGLVVGIRDDGRGFPDIDDESGSINKTGIGLTLMEALADQLRGRLSIRNESGAAVELRVPREPR